MAPIVEKNESPLERDCDNGAGRVGLPKRVTAITVGFVIAKQQAFFRSGHVTPVKVKTTGDRSTAPCLTTKAYGVSGDNHLHKNHTSVQQRNRTSRHLGEVTNR